MPHRRRSTTLGCVIALVLGAAEVLAQEPPQPRAPLSLEPLPGRSAPVGDIPGRTEGILGGRPGPSVPRVPFAVTRPREVFGIPAAPVSPISEVPGIEMPLYGPLEIPDVEDDEGPPHGMTLDMAIHRLLQANLELRALAMEIPQARADIITAGLRDNPVFFADGQLLPYQRYTEERPGGPAQYDINITYPLDLNKKRFIRAEVATRAMRVVEAQYQDAVRLQIDNLYRAFVDVLAARETIRFARASIEGLGRLGQVVDAQLRAGEITPAEVRRVRILHDSAAIGLMEAEQSFREAKWELAPLLNLSPAEAEVIELRGTIYQATPPPPPGPELVHLALRVRPDLVAYRLGLQLAAADVRLARAERFSDVFLLVQPYTFQDLSPFGLKSAHSWALGVTVPLPVYNRNQGNIRRAQINITKTQTEMAALEQLVTAEVLQAESRYYVTRTAVFQIERELLPDARQVRDETFQRFEAGEEDIVSYLNAQRDYNELVRQYRDTVIQHRRSMLELNTVVGHRILP